MSCYCYFDSEQSDGHMGCFFPTRGHHVCILNLNPPHTHTHTQTGTMHTYLLPLWTMCGVLQQQMTVVQCTISGSGLCSDVFNTCDSSDKVLSVDSHIIFFVMSCEWILIIQCVDVITTFFQNSYNQHTSIPLPKYFYLRRLKLGILEILNI